MAPHSSTPAWKIPWAEEPGRLQSMRSLRVRCNWATSLSLFTFMHWRRKWQPTPVFLPGESQGAAVYGVAQNRTRLKRLSSSSSSSSRSMATLQCCGSFRWTTKGLSHTYICIHSPPNSPQTWEMVTWGAWWSEGPRAARETGWPNLLGCEQGDPGHSFSPSCVL